MEKYKKMIDSLLVDVDNYHKEDLIQELYLTILKIQNENKTNINNLDSYIYISLKNRKTAFLKEKKKEKYISLNMSTDDNNDELINKIPSHDNFSFSDEKVEFCKAILDFPPNILSETEKKFLIDYYQHNKKQITIAKENNVSPQYVSKTLKKVLKKVFEFFRSFIK